MKRMIRAAEGEASTSARDNFDDKMDQIQDNFDFAIDGISKIAADGNLAQRAKTRGHTVDGFLALGNLLVKVFAAVGDALHGIGTEFKRMMAFDDLGDFLHREMLGTDLMCHFFIERFMD